MWPIRDAWQFRALRASDLTPRRDQSLALADGVLVNSRVGSDNFTILSDDRARRPRFHSRVLFNKIGIRTALDETDFLGLGLFRCGQSVTPGNFAHFGLPI